MLSMLEHNQVVITFIFGTKLSQIKFMRQVIIYVFLLILKFLNWPANHLHIVLKSSLKKALNNVYCRALPF